MNTNASALDTLNTSAFDLHCSLKECRICLDNPAEGEELVSPCKCTGTLRWVHQLCFLTWLERQYSSKPNGERKTLLENGIACEICKRKVYISLGNKRSCLPASNISEKIRSQALLFAILVFFLILLISCLGLLVYFMRQDESNFAEKLLPTVLFSVALAFFASVIAMGCYYLLTNFFMELRTEVKGFRTRKTKEGRRSVIPI